MGLLDSVIEAAKQQYQTTKRGFGLLASNPQQFAQEATTRYFPTKEEEAQFAQAQAAGGDYTQTPYYQKVMNLSQFQGSIKPTGLINAPQQAALDLAQKNAALPVKQGGLGLPANNTAEMRAAAQDGKNMVHFSRSGGDYTTLDSGKFALAPFDAVGTHVGTPQAAMDRFENTVGYKVNNPNYANDELKGVTYPVTILGNKPLMNQNNMPFGEDDLSAFLRNKGGHNWSDIQGGKMTYQNMNADLRKKLFEEEGYTSIPYFNEVEGKGSISYIVPPENIRSRFAAFDPFRRNAAIAATMGVAAPDLLAAGVPLGLLGTAQQTVNLPEKKKKSKK